MIGRIKGTTIYLGVDHAIVDVGGVGYIIHCSTKTLANMQTGSPAELFIETYVREDQITLYGFLTPQEKLYFLKFVTVKGIGPKLALQMLSALTADQICLGIATKDESVFAAVPGVGPKLVTRILTELKDKDFVSSSLKIGETHLKEEGPQLLRNDAVSALVNLGVNRSEAYVAVSRVLMEQPGIALDKLIASSLQEMVKQR